MIPFNLKKIVPYIVALFVFIVLTVIYCYPEVFEGKVRFAGDTKSWEGMIHENVLYAEETGVHSAWVGSMFSGMPAYQVGGVEVPKPAFFIPFRSILTLGFGGTMFYIICYFIGFFILLRSFKINKWLCIVGSVAITLSSYFLIILGAGHNTKAQTLGLMAPVIAGFFLIFRKHYGWGIILTMIYTAIGFISHPQMSYYICMMIGVFFCAEIYIHIKEKRYKDLLFGTFLFAFSMVIGLGTNLSSILSNSEYARETMRGGHSDLVQIDDDINKTNGLDLDYATQWSYGIDETLTLLIPNFMGGSSNYNTGTNSKVYTALLDYGLSHSNAAQFCNSLPTYWGNQPFTSGPVYVGAIVCFLFILGLLQIKGAYKWAFLIATLMSIFLAWGNNFMPLTKFFFNHFPLYSKFRTPSSILIVAEIAMPLLGFLALNKCLDSSTHTKKTLKNIYIAVGITAGLSLIFALFGSLINVSSPNDVSIFAQLPKEISSAILAERTSMLRSDAFRSFVFIILSAGLLILFIKGKVKSGVLIAGMGLLILLDMWGVDKRFFNNSYFVDEKADNSYFAIQPYEEVILEDTDPHFRVYNMTGSPFNESRTSYRLKSIGGYNAAKLRRYQDLIDEHLSQHNIKVLNMLNAKYIVMNNESGQAQPYINREALGNAWYIDSLIVLSTPNEESNALKSINVANTAVLDDDFASFTEGFVAGNDSTATIKLTKYAPDYLEYSSSAEKAGTAVFSEIYYPYGWKAYIDGEAVEHFRVNYTLRALNIPAGTHHIRFEFRPDSIEKGGMFNKLCWYIIYLTIIYFIYIEIKQRYLRNKVAE